MDSTDYILIIKYMTSLYKEHLDATTGIANSFVKYIASMDENDVEKYQERFDVIRESLDHLVMLQQSYMMTIINLMESSGLIEGTKGHTLQ